MDKESLQQLGDARNCITMAQGHIFHIVKDDPSVTVADLAALDIFSNELEEIKRKIAILARG